MKCLKSVGGRKTEESEMVKIAKSYFVELFTLQGGDGGREHILSGVRRCILKADNVLLTTKYTVDYVFKVVKEMGPSKAPDIYGFPALFF